MPVISKPSESTAIPEETQQLLSRFSDDSESPRVKVCSLISLDLADVLAAVQPDLNHLKRVTKCLG